MLSSTFTKGSLVTTFLFLITACGGGSGNGGTSAATTASTQPAASTAGGTVVTATASATVNPNIAPLVAAASAALDNPLVESLLGLAAISATCTNAQKAVTTAAQKLANDAQNQNEAAVAADSNAVINDAQSLLKACL